MLQTINTKILLSAAVILASAAVIVGATFAFFADTETSTANTFAAGDIDLTIGNTSYALDFNIPNYPSPTGALVASPNNIWTLDNLTIEKFFSFTDLKPGDYGEDTISMRVGSNDAWVCAAANITADKDNSITEPEDEAGLPAGDLLDGTTDGDLDSELQFAFWKDDGDNVLETDEVASLFATGPVSNLNPKGKIALADAQGTNPFGNTPMLGNTTNYIGKGWCFGAMAPTGIAQDGLSTSGPLVRGTGFSCNGSAVGNLSQTDSIEGDLQFFAVQARNNPNFSCETDYVPTWPTPTEVPVTPTPTTP